MICVYASDCTDFSNNGLGPVQPQSCTVTETLNGEWELTLVHPIDDMGRWTRLTEGRILRAPVPAAMTPQMSLVTQQYQTTNYDVLIYKVTTQRDPLRLRSGTGTNYKILGKYKKDTEIIVVDKTTSSWYEVTCPDGKHGYMSAEYLTYVRTETQSTQTNVGFRNEVIESRQLRDQPFRIYRVVPELDKVTVYARHVFYDLLDNMIQRIESSASAVGASVAQNISSNCLSAHDFTFYSDLTATAEDVCFENINPVEAMLGEGGMAEKYGAELARDWFDVFLVKRVGHDTDVHIREKKNLTGISYDVDETDVVTRIMPTGEDADGNILYLPELYVDSPNIGNYVHPKWIHLPVLEAKEVAEGENYKSLTECYQEMRSAAQAEYEKGCDLPTVTLKVDFINCADTVEYAQYSALTNIFLGDSVRVIARRIGVEVSMRMTQYTYDCLTRKYTSVTLGTVADTLEGSMVSARQLASGSITGAKLALNSVGTGQLQSGSVGSLQIKNAAIGSAHIQDASITRAHTVGELVVKGTDGHFYSVSVDADGNITSTLKQVGNDDVQDVSINAGEKIIEGTITAATLNVNDIFANNAIIRSLIAANLDVDTLFAREATVNALNAMDITSNTYLKLMVSGKADKNDVTALDERMGAAELKLTPEAIVSTVTGSQQYKDDLAAISLTASGPEFIVGTQTATTAAWTGNASFSELKDGQQITYWLPFGSAANVTLNLTLKDGTETGAVPCYYSQGTRLGTQYTAGNVLHLTYRENAKFFTTTIPKGWWADANYNTDTYDRIRSGSVPIKETLTAFRFLVGDDGGFFVLAANKPFDIHKPILWNTGTGNAGYVTANVYVAYSSVYLRYQVSDFTGVQGASCYLAGTLSGTTFTPAASYLTCTAPTAEDGLTYLLLGCMSTTTTMTLYPEHPMFRFVDGAFRPLSQVGFEAFAEVGALRTETQTAIAQTNAAIALKADKTTTDDLSTRIDQAEQKVTPEAISSAVTSAALYAYEKYEGRNYCLNSANIHTFVDNKYRYANGTTSNYTGWNLSVSDDLFEHSGNGVCFRISFDMKRTNVDATSASTAGVYSGVWVYYRYYGGDDGTTLYTTGRGWYLRTTDTTFVATDDDWVRLRYGPLNLSSFNPVSIAYFTLGTGNANGTTGTVQFRNIKLEVLDQWTDWSAAPEDIYGLAKRMTNAESNISQNANSIALKVNTATYNTEKVYRGSTAPTTLYTNMLWLDTSVSPNLLKRYTGSTWAVAGAQEVKSSGIYIGSNNVAITTENFLLQLLDPSNNENVLLEMSANGNVGFKELYADEIISGSVAASYNGPSVLYVNASYSGASDTYFRSLGEAVKAVNNRFLKNNVTIYLPSASGEIYEPAGTQIQGVSGPGRLMIYGYSACRLNSYISVKGCSAHIAFQNVSLREIRPLNGSNRNPYLIDLQMNHHVEFNGCTLDANNVTYDSIYCQTTHAYLLNCGLYNAVQGLEVFMGWAYTKNCKGSCSWAMISYAGYIIASGTVPNGSRGTGENGQIFATGVTVDYGTAIPVVTPDSTTIQYATSTKSYRGGWRSDTSDVIQGVYSDSGYSSSLSWNYGCMWFGGLKNVLSGTTIKSATLTLHRKTGSGSGSAKTVYLCAITNASASGSPSIAVTYGAIGTIGRNAQVTFAIPIAAVQGLANGTYGGLCLYETKYNFGSSTYSNCYMRMSGSDTSLQPYLTVVYNDPTSVG